MTAEAIPSHAARAAVSDSQLAADRPAEVVGGIELILSFLRRYGRWLVAVTLLFGALALVYQQVLVRPLFEATAMVAIGPVPPTGAFAAPKLPPAGYLQLAKSANIFERINRELRQSGMRSVGDELERSRMRAELGKPTKGDDANTSLLLLTYWAESDEMAVEVVNSWARVLVGFDLRQAQKAYLKWALADAEERQRNLSERMEQLSTRLAATRAVLETTPGGLYITSRRQDDGSKKPEARSLALSREDRTTVTAELAMRVAETDIEMNLTQPKKEEADRLVAALTMLNDRVEAKDVGFEEVVAQDASGLLAGVRTRASIMQPAATSVQSASGRVLFKTLLAMIAGFLLVLVATGFLEAVRRRQPV